MSIKEHVVRSLEDLSDAELEQVAEYLAFLRFRERLAGVSPVDASQFAPLYAEFGAEDRRLAEEGMEDYADSLFKEDVR